MSPKSVAVTQQWTQLESLLLNRYFLLVEIMQLFCTALPLSRLGAAVSFMGAQQLSDLPGLLERLETRGREVGHIASGALGSDASTLLTASEIGINNRYFALYHALSEQLGPNTISNMTVFRAQAA
ncbi:hypothetical protein [Aliagarivorans taiwanensis]|uniref:hypothetical protein n=1 Tax=Aliagarivorans taiwanensis TaxID=561966 RepID=UPI0012F8F17E|nr:hypothetical protein [Aliagarivorans taiwanensis]